MLCQFKFKNFLSYKNETVFDMRAINMYGQGFEDSLIDKESKTPLLPVSVIYGPNGGGKSNVLKAFAALFGIVNPPIINLSKNNKSLSRFSGLGVEWAPFHFCNETAKKPTEFELFFRIGQIEYRYCLSVFEGNIVFESIYRKKLGSTRSIMIFERDNVGIKLGKSIEKYVMHTNVNERLPFLSFLAITYDIEEIAAILLWFERMMVFSYAIPNIDSQIYLSKDDNLKKLFISSLNDLEINISDYIVEDTSKQNEKKIFVVRTLRGKEYPIEIIYESDGTQKLFSALPIIFDSIRNGRLLVVDELDAKLHPKLLRYIIALFKNPEINKKGAQLIFTSHELSTMKSDVFRRDEIWFAAKNAELESEIYSLYQIKDEKDERISTKSAYNKQYLEGRYGADPYLRTIKSWDGLL